MTRRLFLLLVAGTAAIVFVVIADHIRGSSATEVDTAIALAIHRMQSTPLDYVMILFTKLGSGPVLYLAIAIAAGWAYRRGHRRFSIVLIVNCFAAQALNYALKAMFARERPTLFEIITRPDSFSFPSGHSMSAMAVFGSVAAVVIALRRSLRTRVIVATVLLVVGIGVSRVYLGAHWPFDVLAGYAAGIPFLALTVHLVHGLQRQEGPPQPNESTG